MGRIEFVVLWVPISILGLGAILKHDQWDYCSDECFDCGVSNDLGNSCNQQKEGSEGRFDCAVFPWHARIVHRYKQEVLCNGVILTNDRVLTTANCQGHYHRYGINVYAGGGTNNYANGFQDGIIKSFVPHEGYNMTTCENNIAIIALHERLVWNDRVLPICFSNDYFPIKDGQSATFSGSDIVYTWSYVPLVHFSIVKKLGENIHKDCQKQDHLCTTKNSVSEVENEGGLLTICQDSKRCVLAGIFIRH
ncbi:unnamed protein product [Lepeophtheirus salmonis]|uniref:(salmon louse) hypothetical protein n=1 Tax=Lepeophtheirus salmonis TaxID=72036 RepID=A0A7R8HF15_LEPSM|nr:unnamed protein product [Lepeophtheirus salmonis]CAF3037250.1 unnamed protein product [Lepeophtheirus salmonis]